MSSGFASSWPPHRHVAACAMSLASPSIVDHEVPWLRMRDLSSGGGQRDLADQPVRQSRVPDLGGTAELRHLQWPRRPPGPARTVVLAVYDPPRCEATRKSPAEPCRSESCTPSAPPDRRDPADRPPGLAHPQAHPRLSPSGINLIMDAALVAEAAWRTAADSTDARTGRQAHSSTSDYSD